VPLVAVDSNVIDLFLDCMPTDEHLDASEAQESPPEFEGGDPKRRKELLACFWLRSLVASWRSTLYTFSDVLYAEVRLAPAAPELLGFALEARENHPEEYRVVHPSLRPPTAKLTALGVDLADAEHVADAVGMECDVFLTNDHKLRKRSEVIQAMWGLRLLLPSEFLLEAVRAGAPWPVRVPWPWELLVTGQGVAGHRRGFGSRAPGS
jgi:hypothetical protein